MYTRGLSVLVKVNDGLVLAKVGGRFCMMIVCVIHHNLAYSGFLGVGSQASTDTVPSTP